jgi:hypothetical protein
MEQFPMAPRGEPVARTKICWLPSRASANLIEDAVDLVTLNAPEPCVSKRIRKVLFQIERFQFPTIAWMSRHESAGPYENDEKRPHD